MLTLPQAYPRHTRIDVYTKISVWINTR
jgi:hypothetical protein